MVSEMSHHSTQPLPPPLHPSSPHSLIIPTPNLLPVSKKMTSLLLNSLWPLGFGFHKQILQSGAVYDSNLSLFIMCFVSFFGGESINPILSPDCQVPTLDCRNIQGPPSQINDKKHNMTQKNGHNHF